MAGGGGVSKYEDIDDYGEFILPDKEKSVYFSCCDCALVHAFVLAVEKDTGRESILIIRQNRHTAQLRRHGHGDLQNGNGKWRLIRR